ncbi:MAG TPA: dihydrolipoamide acetyltransferase family protein [Candidatus Baltobacteraceae bacterium]|jgi:2-oxoisovalerate dehydrogenase E2 component (dihydrolipoyl transacylase)|nr:dihydrolipoamide acetyltransferase family protein [Candidatus Baltobacteraceae bacterium]
MPTTITMPQLGETVTEGTVAQWLKNVGDRVEKYEAFVEISTDKVTAEVPSPISGTIRELIAKEGDTVPTGAPIAVIEEASVAGAASPAPAPGNASADSRAPEKTTLSANGLSSVGSSKSAFEEPPVRVSPAVRRLAREHDLNPALLHGTGTGGRITADDVLAATHAEPPKPTTARPPSSAVKPSPTAPVPGQTLQISHARRIIAQRMVESKHTAPHAWTTTEVDVTSAWTWREREKERFRRDQGLPLTLFPFFLRAVVETLREFPLMNARYTEEGIVVHRDVHLGIAVALYDNLIVPVIRNADTLSIGGLAVAAGRLIERARANKLSPDDLMGGTFTVNNTGANGSILSAPIIYSGQAGIITMESIVKRPVVLEGDSIAIRSMMNVCLSIDHRLIDGAIASSFLASVRKRLTSMGPDGSL